MSKVSIDYAKLEDKIYKRAYKLSEVKDKIEKVGFDIVRFKDSDAGANLWQIQDAEDGQYIVALYADDEVKIACEWAVRINKTASALEISYKGDPIVRIASSKLGVPPQELHKAERYLPSKLAENKKLVKSLLNELSETAKKEVLNKYPELY
jgi:hypothetical protein